jgi:predicted HicB family RNase H-like nuclease
MSAEPSSFRNFSLRLDEDLSDELRAAAKAADRSAGSFIRACLRETIKNWRRDQRREDIGR